MTPKFGADIEFSRLLRSEEPASLERIALEIARDGNPDLNLASYLDRIDSMAATVKPRVPDASTKVEALRQINWHLYQELGFRGNESDFNDPRNSLLDQVIDHRLGIPITLSILHRAVASRLGIDLAGVGLPAHFMLRTLPPEPEVFIDAFDQGRLLDREGCRRVVERRIGGHAPLRDVHFEPSSTRSIVERVLRNLRDASRASRDPQILLSTLERLHALAPEDSNSTIELAVLLRGAEQPGRALEVVDEGIRSEASDDSLVDLHRLKALLTRDIASRN